MARHPEGVVVWEGSGAVNPAAPIPITLVCTWQAPEMFNLDLMRLAVMRLQVKP